MFKVQTILFLRDFILRLSDHSTTSKMHYIKPGYV